MFDFAALKGAVVAPNYRVGAYVAHVLHEERKTIYTINKKVLSYTNAETVIFLEEDIANQEEEKISIIEEVENYACKQIVAHSLQEVQDLITQYRVVCADIEFEGIAEALGYETITECAFLDSFEGVVWQQIIDLFNLRNNGLPCSAELFDKLEAFQDHQINNENCLPYVQYSPLKNAQFVQEVDALLANKKFTDLFRMLTKQEPFWRPQTFDAQEQLFIKNAKMLMKKAGSNGVLIDKALAQFCLEPVLYIGKIPAQGVMLQVLYEPRFTQHAAWPRYEIDLQPVSLYEQKLELQGEISKLYAHNLNVKIDQKNIYGYIRKCALKEMRAYSEGYQANHDWKNYLEKSGIEYMKMLDKAEKWIENFIEWLKTVEPRLHIEWFKQVQSDLYVDFYAKREKTYIAKFVWNAPTKKMIYADPMLKAISAQNPEAIFVIITPENIIQIDAEKFEEKIELATKPKSLPEDDLFYWGE